MIRDVLIIRDPKVAKLFACEARREILHNLRRKELTAADLARALDKSNSSIVHHLGLLKDAGLVEQTRTEVKRNLIQTYYRATARNFIISYNFSDSYSSEAKDIMNWSREILRKSLGGLEAFGYKIPEDDVPSLVQRLDLWKRLKKTAYEEAAEQQIAPTGLEAPAFNIIMDLLSDLRLAERSEFKELAGELADNLARYSTKAV